MKYFGAAGEYLQMLFNFEVNQHLFYALAQRFLTTRQSDASDKVAADHRAIGTIS